MKGILRAGLAALLALAGAAQAAPGEAAFPAAPLSGGAGVFAKSASAPSTPTSLAPAVKAELLSAQTAAVPGKPLQLSVRLTHETGWHTYWKNPGDAGSPTELEWRLPKGWSVSEPAWPVPAAHRTQSLTDFTLGGDTLLPVTASVPKSARGAAKLEALVSWVACKEQCVPGEQNVSIELPVAPSASPTPEAPAIREALDALPKPAPKGFAEAFLDGRRLVIVLSREARGLEFFPDAPGLVDLAAAPRIMTQESRTALVLKAAEDLKEAPAKISGVLQLAGDGVPQAFELQLPLKAIAPNNPFAGAALSAISGPPSGNSVSNAAEGGGSGESDRLTLLTAALFAALGGLILNLMPCVFPVLSLKILGLVRASEKKSLLPHGIAFTAGVLLTMTALSGLLLALKALGAGIGWGFQLQSPAVVLALALLFFAITANLAGLYEFTLGSRAAGGLSTKAPAQGLSGSFFTGILAVIVASPCTAPFMGAAVGFALAQSAPVALAVFLSLGAGMALPWLLLTAFPGWTRALPRPGAWMVTLRRFMAIPVALALFWLLWVLSKQVPAAGFAAALASLVLFGAALYLYGRGQLGKKGASRLAVLPLVLAAGLALFTATSKLPAPAAGLDAGWEPWSPEAVASATAEGRPVFVDFTAAWCVTCQVNKKAVLDTEEVREAFRSKGYRLFLADWTNKDEAISRELDRYRHSGVPLYLVISPDGHVRVLPELLTREALLKAIEP